MAGHRGSGPRDLLSPESGSLVRQLEVRIKELKGWLRDTELFIFNSCLRQEKEGTMSAEKQLQYFQVIKKQSELIKSFLYGRDEIFIKYIKYYTHVSMYHCALKCFLEFIDTLHISYMPAPVCIKMNVKRIKYSSDGGSSAAAGVFCAVLVEGRL